MIQLTEASAVIHIVESIASISVCISCIELLSYPQQLNDNGVMSWRVFQLRHRWFVRGLLANVLDRIFSYPAFLAIIVIRLAAASLLLVVAPNDTQRAVLVGIVAVMSLCLPLRSPYGMDGADQMTVTTFGGLALVHLCSGPTVDKAGLWFLTLQVCLSYLTAGVVKATSPVWRDGSGLTGVFSTRAYGNAWLALRLTEHPALGRLLSWSVIVAECLFSLVLVLPMPFALAFLIWGVMFHFLGAVIMGLNTFFWSFVALYPAIIYCVTQYG
ncbi:MAG: hypothetical protein QOH93_533 [Chloroflexia bacterium]|jgi:hypothetical protein|nr:hypothetical protein [Chloroflexia bacterium]